MMATRSSSRNRPCITALACAHPSGAVSAGLGVCSLVLLLVLQRDGSRVGSSVHQLPPAVQIIALRLRGGRKPR